MLNLFIKTIYDKRSFIIGWSLGMAFIGFLMTVFYPAFQQDNGIDQLLESLPPAFQGLVGDLANLKQMSTYLGAQLFEIRIPIFLSVMTIILAIGLTVGEEDRGQLRTLLTTPLSRGRIMFEKWLAGVFVAFVTSLAVMFGIWIGFLTIGEGTDLDVLIRLNSFMWLLSVTMISMIMGFGLATGKKGLTNAGAVTIMVGGFLLSTFAQAVDWLEPYVFLSVFNYFPAPDIASGTIEWMNVWVLCGLAVVSMALGWLFFRSRDVN